MNKSSYNFVRWMIKCEKLKGQWRLQGSGITRNIFQNMFLVFLRNSITEYYVLNFCSWVWHFRREVTEFSFEKYIYENLCDCIRGTI